MKCQYCQSVSSVTTACCSIQQVASGQVGPNSASPGSTTNNNPASGGGLDSSAKCRTLANVIHHEQCGQLWSLSTCTISLLILSLVFIMIWSSVISTVLVTHSYYENESTKNMVDLFSLYNNIAQLTFALGREMVSSLNCSLVEEVHQPEAATRRAECHNRTDLLLRQMSQTFVVKGFVNVESLIGDQLAGLRRECVNHSLADCVRLYQSLFSNLDLMAVKDNQWLVERHARMTVADMTLRTMPYMLFVNGAMHRFTALGLGWILVRSNFDHHLLNISEYFQHFHTSRQQFESSFVWNIRFFQKYLELEQSEYQTELLVSEFNRKRFEERENFQQMEKIFQQLFNQESLTRIRSLIKKKNVESVERVLVNESGSPKYVADLDANLVTIQLDSDLFQTIGLEQLERVVLFKDQAKANLSREYERLIRNQVAFMIRVQDFLNISLNSHVAQMAANEQHNLLYHFLIATILIVSVLFCFTLFLCAYYCGRHSNTCCDVSKSILTRRARRRYWTPFSLFKGCFGYTATATTTPVVTRYPLHYKANQHHHHHCHHQRSNGNYSCGSNQPPTFMVSSSSKRTFAGSVINRYQATPIGKDSSNSTKTALLTYKFENSRSNRAGCNTSELETRNGTTRTCACCISCPEICEADECPRGGGKCSICCTCDSPATSGRSPAKASSSSPAKEKKSKSKQQQQQSPAIPMEPINSSPKSDSSRKSNGTL